MINVLGIGVPSVSDAWLVRRVCARLETGELTIVVSADPQARMALLDAVTARQIPTEGRVWIDGIPVMRETVRLVRERVGEVDLQGPLANDRSLLWNILLVPGRRPRALWTGLRLASPGFRERALRALRSVGLERRAHERVAGLDPGSRRRMLIARVLVRRPRSVVLPEADEGLSLSDAADVLGLLRTLARCERLAVLVSVAHPILVETFAHRVLAIANGSIVFDAPPSGAIAEPTWTPAALAKTG